MQRKYKEDIYDKSFYFSVRLFRFLQKLPRVNSFYILTDQALRSGTSIGANLIEGKSSSSRKELIRYCEIALKSANETLYWLRLIKELIVSEIGTDELIEEVDQLRKIIAAIVIKLKGL